MTKLFPGMTDEHTEFFRDNGQIKFISNGKIDNLSNLPKDKLKIIKDFINNDLGLKKELQTHHPNDEFKQIEMFISCRFGALNKTPDIENGQLMGAEFVDCPLQGKCKSEGFLCAIHLNFKGQNISAQEHILWKKLTTSKTNDVIADEMNLPMGTFHLIKKKFYRKLGILTRPELTVLAFDFGIL